MSPRVLVSDPIAVEGIGILRSEGLEVDEAPGLTPAELAARLSGVEGWIVRSATRATRELIQSADSLRVIGRAGSGVDNVDVAAASERGIVVLNVPGGNTLAVAELAFGFMLALARQIPRADQVTRGGAWEKNEFGGVELQGKTLGILGYGRIGREVGTRARAFGMRVLAHDPLVTQSEPGGAELVSMARRLGESDFLTIHAPLAAGTQALLGATEMAQMKSGARLVNCARGGIVDELALYEALESGHLGGAALDVFQLEPPGAHPLFSLPNVIATPHLGAATREAQARVGTLIARYVADALLGRGVQNAVNLAALEGR